MSKLMLLTCAAAILCLSACGRPGGPAARNGQNAQQMAQNDPYAQAPAPYMNNPDGRQPAAWPGAVPQNPNPQNPTFQNPNPQNPQPMQPTGGPTGTTPAISGAPQGMTPLQSQAGHVYRASLAGSTPVPQQSRDFYMKLIPFFDGQPQVMGYLDDPSGRMAQVGFQATKGGVPVMGMLVVTQTQNGAVAVVMLDSPDRFQSSLQAMNAAAQQP